MKQLYFCRHGESQANVDRILAGQLDSPLTALGREQAVTAGERAYSIGIEYILSSPQVRASETVQIIAKAIGYPAEDIEYMDLLKEIDYGSATGKSYDADLSDISDIEATESLAERARLVYEHVKALPQDVVLVVGHGHFWQEFYKVIHPDRVITAADEPANAEIMQLI